MEGGLEIYQNQVTFITSFKIKRICNNVKNMQLLKGPKHTLRGLNAREPTFCNGNIDMHFEIAKINIATFKSN